MCPPGPWRLRPVHTTKRASAPELGLQARGWMSAQCARGETEGRKDRGSPSRMEGDHPDAAELRSQPASCSTGTGWKGSSGRRRTFGRVRASGDGTAENMTRPPLSVCASAPLWIALKHSAGATTCSVRGCTVFISGRKRRLAGRWLGPKSKTKRSRGGEAAHQSTRAGMKLTYDPSSLAPDSTSATAH